MVRRLLENSFMSLSISCFISGGRLANSSELMSTELGSPYNSPLSLRENCITLLSYSQNHTSADAMLFGGVALVHVIILPDTCENRQPSPRTLFLPPLPPLPPLNCKSKTHQNDYTNSITGEITI